MIVKTKLSDKTIQFEGRHPELNEFFKEYITQDSYPELFFSWTDEEISAEQALIQDKSLPIFYLETLVALRKLAEILPQHKRLLIHGASISYKDKAYLFCAPSGTGKSTHIRLWKQYLKEHVGIVNGDKPFISLEGNLPIIYGTPWAGKENWHRNCSFSLGGICFIKQGINNKMRQLDISECLPLLIQQVYIPKDPVSAGATLELLDTLIKHVPLYLLECDISEEAVQCSFQALTGLCYPPKC